MPVTLCKKSNVPWAIRRDRYIEFCNTVSQNSHIISQLVLAGGGGNVADTEKLFYSFNQTIKPGYDEYSKAKCDMVEVDLDRSALVPLAFSSCAWAIKHGVCVSFKSSNTLLVNAVAKIINCISDNTCVVGASSDYVLALPKGENQFSLERKELCDFVDKYSASIYFENGAFSTPKTVYVTEENDKDLLIYLLTEKGGRYCNTRETDRYLKAVNTGEDVTKTFSNVGICYRETDRFVITDETTVNTPLPIVTVRVGELPKKNKVSNGKNENDKFDFQIVKK